MRFFDDLALSVRKTIGDRTPSRSLYKLFEDHFDHIYFMKQYAHLLPRSIIRKPAMFSFYLRHVREWALDPNSVFCEKEYLSIYDDVSAAVAREEFVCGFHHWILHGQREGRICRRTNSEIANITLSRKKIESLFVPEYYTSTFMKVARSDTKKEDALEHFLSYGLKCGAVPVPPEMFDEEFYVDYYEDVRLAKRKGLIPSGYCHYVHTGMAEGRVPTHDISRLLTAKLGDLASPVGFKRIDGLISRLKPIPMTLSSSRPLVFNVFIPSIDPDIMFGGYIAFMHFLCRLVESGQKIRFLIMEDGQSNKTWFLRGIASRPRWTRAFAEQEFLNISTKEDAVGFNPNDVCVAYSCWTMHDAWSVARHLKRKYVLFFIQEFEPVFHELDSMHFVASSAYLLPHVAIFNSEPLKEYFEKESLGVFSTQGTGRFLHFSHVVGGTRSSRAGISKGGERKRLLCYARPEKHAARNLFEVCVIVLSSAIRQGVFDGEWEFHGIGTLGTSHSVDLGNGREMKITSRVEQGEFEALLRSFDVGLSLMWAPHPGVIHFEMARAGIVTVINSFGNRTKDSSNRLGYNIVACDPSIDDLVEGLRIAVRRCADAEARIRGSEITLPSDWDHVFDTSFYERLQALLSSDQSSSATRPTAAATVGE